jgi:methylglutaconyl-CoA hydratase
MTESPRVRVERQGDLARIVLDDARRANALSPEIITALTETYRRDWRAEGVRALLLSAAGRNFSAGADLAHLESLRDAGLDENRADSERLKELFRAILEQPALTVALVQGACVAGGCGVATAHDFVIAAKNARFLYSEVRIGFVAALVATFLPLRCRGREIRELLLNPEFVTASRALKIGLVNRLAAADELAAAGEALVAEVLERASSESVALTKRLLLDLIGRPLGEALDLAAEVNARARLTADCRRGIATFLATKSTPNWRQ